MKRQGFQAVAALTILVVLAVLSGCASTESAKYVAGTYLGEGKGHGGAIKVSVTVNAQKIEKIQVVENAETAVLGDTAFEEISKAIIANNSTDIDAVSGATDSSKGYIAAVNDALAKAGVKLAGGKKPSAAAQEVKFEASYDVVVIGAGGAGLSAALAAHEGGAKVVVVEKMPVLGGNSLRSTGGLNAAGTSQQKKLGIQDSPELFFKDTMKGGYNRNDPALVKVLTERAGSSVDWLISLGADMNEVTRSGGASVPRAHLPTGGYAVGPEIVKTLRNAVITVNKIPVYVNTKALAILKNDRGAVNGVKVKAADGKEYLLKAKAVIDAAGGFGANSEMVVKYVPRLKGFGTTNHPGATGDGMVMAEEAGAVLIDMDQIQTHPTVVPGKEMITEAVRGNGALLINKEGKRFVNELETRDVVSAKILGQNGKTAFLLFDEGVRQSLKAIEDYVKGGYTIQAGSPEELAGKMGVSASVLKETLDAYNGYVANKKDPDFGRPDLPRKMEKNSYYAIEVAPAVHHTMGGVKIDPTTRVLDAQGKPIPGFYAAGEVTGGVHGANRLGGNAVADIITFGRIAGAGAAEFAKK